MSGKIFTPLEANRTLPLVRRIVADILERGREIRVLWQREDSLTEEEALRAMEIADELEGLHRELDAIGCSFRSHDFSRGLVDFPALIGGQLVHLCWRDDEPELRHYHDPREGFAGRRPIPAELLASP